jgi:hypothetical protein
VVADATLGVAGVSTILVAVVNPVTVNEAVSLVNPDAEAVIVVAVPAKLPVNVLVATPAEAVLVPVPDTVEVPPAAAKVTVSVAVVTVLPYASVIVAVIT